MVASNYRTNDESRYFTGTPITKGNGTAKADKYIAGDGDNTVKTLGGDDYIDAGDGDDKVSAGIGNDKVIAGNGDDVVSAGSGNDIVIGGEGNDNIKGEGGNDVLVGGNGNDIINGGTGNDIIIAGAGDDVIYLGSGNDLVVFGQGDDHDIVKDFKVGDDSILIKGSIEDVTEVVSSGKDVTLTLSDGSSLKIVNLLKGDLADTTIENLDDLENALEDKVYFSSDLAEELPTGDNGGADDGTTPPAETVGVPPVVPTV